MSNHFFSSFYLYKEHKELFLDEPKRAFVQYKKFRLDLLTGKRADVGINKFFQDLETLKVEDQFENPVVIHLFYELGYSCVGLDVKADENTPLALFIEYTQSVEKNIFRSQEVEPLSFESLSSVSFEEYHQKFNQVYQNLLDGETYQLNLTHPFYLRPSKLLSARKFINRLWADPLKVGAFAHTTYVGSLDKLFLSNSPECLFQIKQIDKEFKILTMPIKGTLKVEEDNYDDAWQKLERDEKNQAELYMITDLMRNDLTRLTMNPANVVHDKYPLHVPGLIHQFSVVESSLSAKENLANIVKNLFPGGSITGAPKKNTMELIEKIEKFKRGFYCGSTILCYKNRKTASINIRSAEIDYTQNEVTYGAGGGITLQSQALEEFEETLNKLKSFLLLF
ncbi:MAG: chorismate-binding protein [Bdellovibrionota bacterium]|nr:chorismate-binding protein [Bdellovibrionota bacterium]